MIKLKERLANKTIGDLLLSFTRMAYRYADKRLNPTFAAPSDYVFTDRQTGAKNMLIVLAGYQPYYFDGLFERVLACQKQFSEEIDICICCSKAPKESVKRLEHIALENCWSLLYLKKNRVAQIQNTVIHLHPSAEWIFKIDEDILLPAHYFDNMKMAYQKAEETLSYRVGFVGPVLNINAFGTESFLRTINKWDEFQSRFGRYRVGGMINTPEDNIHRNQDWARYIWEKSIPFDEVASQVSQVDSIEICPIRFSIGAILINRSFLEYNGFFPVFRQGGMGCDEKYLCNTCIEGMYSIVVASGIFVGHLGFGPQKDACRDFYDSHQKEIRLNHE